MKNEYHRIVICSIFTRPNRSASVPENQPPSEEISSVTVPISPASPRERPQTAMMVGITKLYIWTSKASSDHPPKQAHIVLRSFAVRSRNQASMATTPQGLFRSWRSAARPVVGAILDGSSVDRERLDPGA